MSNNLIINEWNKRFVIKENIFVPAVKVNESYLLNMGVYSVNKRTNK